MGLLIGLLVVWAVLIVLGVVIKSLLLGPFRSPVSSAQEPSGAGVHRDQRQRRSPLARRAQGTADQPQYGAA
jgi:hypothetical protein